MLFCCQLNKTTTGKRSYVLLFHLIRHRKLYYSCDPCRCRRRHGPGHLLL